MEKLANIGDHYIYSYDVSTHPFIEYFYDLYNTRELTNIHIASEHYIKYQEGLLNDLTDIESDLHKKFYTDIKTNSRFKELYCNFIKTIYDNLFPTSEIIIYQSFPSIRIQYPGSKTVPPHKDSDNIGRHPLGEKNFIIPITKMYNSNTIWIESVPDKEDFRPVELEYGQLFYFNGNTCTHYNLPNKDQLRISLDFRILLPEDYLNYVNNGDITITNPRDPEKSRVPTKMTIGGYYQIALKNEPLESMMNWMHLSKSRIMQSRPVFGDEEKGAIIEYMNTDPFITEYKKTLDLEKVLATYIGSKYCIMTTSGTTAIMLALYAHGVTVGDEVIVPNYTMVATVNAVLAVGAKPIIIDVGKCGTLMVDAVSAALTPATKVVLHVSLNNRSADLRKLVALCEKHHIQLIEDAAQSLGSHYDNQHYGTFGSIGCFSLSTPKIISTGQGGFCVTDDLELATRMNKIKNFGRNESGSDIYDCFGLNFKITDLQAVIGLEQVKKLPYRRKRLQQMYEIYYTNLHDIVHMFPADKDWIPWFVDIYVQNPEKLQQYLALHHIDSRLAYPMIDNSINSPNSKYFSAKGLFLPTHFLLSDQDIYHICKLIRLAGEQKAILQ